MKYKVLSTGTLVSCDGSRHNYHKDVNNQPDSALCWCKTANSEQLSRWSDSISTAMVRRASGELSVSD